jgi:pyruvate dehydrogenase E1 component alpha subunit
MELIRAFDSMLPVLYTKGLLRGSSHAAIGQEAVAVGACSALEPRDYITSTHRGHGHVIARGAEVKRMMAELLGRQDGYCRGKGGSMHIADFSIGVLGANGIVGGGFGLAGGAALTASMRGEGQVVLCFFGEGAVNQGAFHEVANMAAIWRLPLIFMCENNQFAMSGRVGKMTSVENLADRAHAYGVPGEAVDGMDVLAVYDSASRAVQRARDGGGPSLIVATCYRFEGHFSGDVQGYRTTEEAAIWRDRDPIERFRESLVSQGALTCEAADGLRASAADEIAAALEYAKESPLPEPAEVWEDVLA